jgi:hypothetical protein
MSADSSDWLTPFSSLNNNLLNTSDLENVVDNLIPQFQALIDQQQALWIDLNDKVKNRAGITYIFNDSNVDNSELAQTSLDFTALSDTAVLELQMIEDLTTSLLNGCNQLIDLLHSINTTANYAKSKVTTIPGQADAAIANFTAMVADWQQSVNDFFLRAQFVDSVPSIKSMIVGDVPQIMADVNSHISCQPLAENLFSLQEGFCGTFL